MRRYFSLLCILALLVGCYNTDEHLINEPIPSDGRIFTASFEQNDTRTYVEEGNLLRWNEGDQITIFDSNTLNQQYQFDGETGDNGGTFSKVSNSFGTGNDLNCHYAVYPYNKDIKITETGVITSNLPAEQSYAENSFGLGANTMVAVTKDVDDTFLKFKNVGGYLKLQLYGDNVTVKSITLTGNNNEKLAGKATITPAYGQSPTLAMSDDATTSITLDCGEGVKIGTTEETATAFWIVVPPTTFEEGLTITITEIDGESFNKSTSNAVVVERNIIKPMAAFDVEIEKIPNNQIWYTSTYGKISPDSDAFGVAITSNVYQDGEGIITFDGVVRKIGDDAFIAQDRLASITLPNSVKSIGREAFASCTSLTSIIMSKNITTIEREAFEECSSLTSISIPNGVTQIEFETFRDCSSLTSVTIPNSVISVGGSSFDNCTSLTSVNIPNSVTSIYGTTFYGCASLKSIVVEQGNPIYDSRENCNAIIETETNKLISGCNNTSIPSSVTSISQQAFSGRTSLTSILVPNSVTSIEFLAFANCTSLASITIGSGVTDIATKAFLGCTSLSTVDITATIPPQIYNETFTNCSSNLKIYVPAGSLEAYKAAEYWKDLNIIEDGAPIVNCTSAGCLDHLISSEYPEPYQISALQIVGNLNGTDIRYLRKMAGREEDGTATSGKLIYLDLTEANIVAGGDYYYMPKSGTKYYTENNVAGDYMFYFCNLETIKFPATVTKLGKSVCSHLPNSIGNENIEGDDHIGTFKSIILPEGIAIISDKAFAWNQNLDSIELPNTVTQTGEATFYRCDALTSIYIPDSVEQCPSFTACFGLKYIRLSENPKFTYIGSAFRGCKSLTTLTIPANIKTISSDAFGTQYESSALTEIHFKATTPPSLHENSRLPAICKIYVPIGSYNAYKSAATFKNYTIIEE